MHTVITVSASNPVAVCRHPERINPLCLFVGWKTLSSCHCMFKKRLAEVCFNQNAVSCSEGCRFIFAAWAATDAKIALQCAGVKI